MAGRSIIGELRKRKVVQAAAIYGAVAWGATEVVVTVVDRLFLPHWVATLAVIGFVVGFPLATSTRLGVARLVEGSLRRQGNKLKVSVQLIEGSSGLALWSETFKRGPNELLALQPNPGISRLFLMRSYDELIDAAEELVIDEPDNVFMRYLLAFAYNATARYESAVRILGTTGLPETVMEMPRRGDDWNGFYTLVNALMGAGETEMARGLAKWYLNDTTYHQNSDWYTATHIACFLALLGRDDEALKKLESIRQSPSLAWAPVLKDAPCFQGYADEPVYLETVRYFDERRAALRERLPATLAAFGVNL